MKKIAIMDKKIKNLHLGFSVAELLLSMLVVMVIAAAMVPVIGPKKMKVPNLNKSHGIFECYYDQSGVLTQYHANNRGQKDAQPQPAEGGDHCVFHVPAADRYEIYAIGAGSSGYRNPEHVGFTITPDATPLTGNLTINNFTNDIVALSTLTNQTKGITEGSFANSVREALNTWSRNRQNEGLGLYFAFTNLATPLDRGGNGANMSHRAGGDVYTSQGYNCASLCSSSSGCPGPYSKPGGGYWTTDYNVGLAAAPSHNKCYVVQYARGGDSTPGRRMRAGDVLLMPVDGLTATNGGFGVKFDAKSAKIITSTRQGSAMIELRQKPNSSDGSIDAKSTATGLSDGQDQHTAFPDLFSNNARIAMLRRGGTIRPLKIEDLDLWDSRSGGYTTGQSATSGSANYVNDAFTWRFTKLKARYEYGNAGKQGQVNVMSYSNLHGNVYCYPGVSDPEAGTAIPTVVSKENNRNINSPGVIVSAESYATPGEPDVYESDLDTGKMPLPDQNIIDLATANNDGLAPYIYKMQASGFRGGLYNCHKAPINSCPGYAGSGAFPFIDVAAATNTLTITDNQSAYSNGSYTANYPLQLVAPGGKCPSGATLTKPGTKSYVDGNGKTQTYQERYCIASEATRRDGAVVIIW